jgi:hypothetical protein
VIVPSSDPDDALRQPVREDRVVAMEDQDARGQRLDLLRRLASHDEPLLCRVLRPSSAPDLDQICALDRTTRLLVCLGALLAVDAGTPSVRWAAELACAYGAGVDAIAAVLLSAGQTAGSAQLVASASRLATALDLEPGLE